MPIRDIALTLFVAGMLPVALRRPWIGILLWTWIGLMNPHTLTWDFASKIPFAFIVAIVTMIGVLFSSEPKRIPLQKTIIALIAMDCWFGVTTLFALNPDEAWPQLIKVVKIQIGIFLTLLLLQSKQRIIWLVWVAAMSLAFFGIKGGLYTIRSGGGGMVLGPPGGFIAGNTEIALAITIVTPLLFYLAHQSEQRWLRLALYAGVALCFVAVIGSYSRGGLLAILAMGTFLWWKSRKKALLTLLIIPFVVIAALLMPSQWYEKMGTIQNYETDMSAQGRLDSWKFAVNLAKDRPIVGGGFETFTPSAFARWAPDARKPKDAHSIWFEVLGEHGFVGLGFFLLVWGLTWRTAGEIIRLSGSRPELAWARDLAPMVQVSLIGYWVGGTFLGLAYFDLPYVMLAILVLTHREVLKVIHQQPQPVATSSFERRHSIPATAERQAGVVGRV